MIKKIRYISIFLLLSTTASMAQNKISSPYSRYGLGTLNNRNTISSLSMGGLSKGVQLRNTINIGNPASFQSIDSLGFMVDASIYTFNGNAKNSTAEQSSSYISLGYISLGFSINKIWKTSIGVLPFSDIGYKISVAGTDTNFGNHSYQYFGDGGLTQLYWGNSLKIFKGLSIGLNSSYIFGTLNKNRSVQFTDLNFLGTNEKVKTNIKGFNFLLGAQYKKELKSDYFITTGLTYGIKSDLNATDEIFTTTFLINSLGNRVTKDTIENNVSKEGKITIPMSLGGGFSFGKEDNFLVGVDFDWQNWSKYSIYNKSDSLTNSFQIAIGGLYVINPTSNKFIEKIKYSAGFRYGKSYLELKNTTLNEYGINFGLSIPLKRKNSLNIGVEIGKRGTVANNLIQESFTKIYIGLKLWDNMYVRKKLD